MSALTDPGSGLGHVHVVLQAGGKGERMRAGGPSKPLVEVGGMPMIARLIGQLARAGARDLTVITGWQAEAVERQVGALPRAGDLRIDFFREPEPLGTMGALAYAARPERPVLFCFADLVTDLDFRDLLAAHRSGGADITLCSHYETHRLRLGELVVEGEEVRAYAEKPLKTFLICSGIAMLEPAAVALLRAGTPGGFPELVTLAVAEGLRVRHWVHGAFWRDVNSPEEAAEADRALRNPQINEERGT